MGYDVQIIKRLLGHQSLSSTMVYLHVSQKHLASISIALYRQEPFAKAVKNGLIATMIFFFLNRP
jgi:site-specific recombinase XerC